MIACRLSFENHSIFCVTEAMYDWSGLTTGDFGVARFRFNTNTEQLEKLSEVDDNGSAPVYYFIGFMKSPESGDKLMVVTDFNPLMSIMPERGRSKHETV